MNRVTTVFRGKSLVVERFDHPEHCFHQDPESEPTECIDVTFVERGAFEMMQGRERWAFSPGDVLVSRPGLKRQYRHLQECPEDVCLSVSFAPDMVEDALGKPPGPLGPPGPTGNLPNPPSRGSGS